MSERKSRQAHDRGERPRGSCKRVREVGERRRRRKRKKKRKKEEETGKVLQVSLRSSPKIFARNASQQQQK